VLSQDILSCLQRLTISVAVAHWDDSLSSTWPHHVWWDVKPYSTTTAHWDDSYDSFTDRIMLSLLMTVIVVAWFL